MNNFDKVMIVTIFVACVAMALIAMYTGHVENMAKIAAGCVK